MLYSLSQVKIDANKKVDKNLLENIIEKKLHLSKNKISHLQIVKKSIDARNKIEVFYVYTVEFEVFDKKSNANLKRNRNKNLKIITKSTEYTLPKTNNGKQLFRSIVVGFGPAGIFSAYLLALSGLKPIIIERGSDVDTRIKDVENFWLTGKLNTNSNVQFGEGGAGTFSDGKLTTLVNDKSGRNKFVLETFVKFGADENILIDSKPHIGTDVLSKVIKNIREEIIKLGGEFYFNSLVTDYEIVNSDDSKDKNSKENADYVQLKVINKKDQTCTFFKSKNIILAIGHSSRDTFSLLYNKGFDMKAKSFAVGVRIEHKQEFINKSQYGGNYKDKYKDTLGAANYKLSTTLENGRGVYSFCMCPGGWVVNASSEEMETAINGMSYHKRDGKNSNSAIIVTVTPKDFDDNSPLSGVEFQRRLEKNTFNIGKGKVPYMYFSEFEGKDINVENTGITPSIKGQKIHCDIRNIFPKEIYNSLIEGINIFANKIKGFNHPFAIISAVESRTSSPVKIIRDTETLKSNMPYFYPCGEGAGYAGGIMSAAMDGMKVAEKIIEQI